MNETPKYSAEQLRQAQDVLRRMADQGCGTASIKIVLDWARELEVALNWQTACVSCARVLESSIKETEAKERAVRMAEEYRKDAQDARSWSDLLKKALMRSNEKYRKAHRRALEAERKLSAMQLIPVYITDHTFDGEEGGLCPTEIFGVKCGLGEDFHHMKPSRCPEPDTCFCDCSCPDPKNLGHTCPLHSGKGNPALTEWEEHVLSYGTVPGEDQYGEHRYLSTACHHLNHDECRLTCKWCPAKCLCDCHDKPSVAEETIPDPVEELAAASVSALDAKNPFVGYRCPANSSDSCVYESQGFRRCSKGCEIAPAA